MTKCPQIYAGRVPCVRFRRHPSASVRWGGGRRSLWSRLSLWRTGSGWSLRKGGGGVPPSSAFFRLLPASSGFFRGHPPGVRKVFLRKTWRGGAPAALTERRSVPPFIALYRFAAKKFFLKTECQSLLTSVPTIWRMAREHARPTGREFAEVRGWAAWPIMKNFEKPRSTA
jgi:hypothetical protein